MTITEYMNPEKFPMTSQKGSSPENQLWLDAFNYDQLEEAIAGGLQMNEMQIKARAELKIKRPWMAELTKQLAAAKKIDKDPKLTQTPMINSDMGEDPVDELIDDDDNYAAHLGNAILAIINDAGLSRDEKRQKVLGALKLLDEDDEEEEMPEMAPPPMINTEMAETPKEPFDQAFLDRLPPSDRPFKKLSAEETKLICEQVVRFQKVMKEQLERDKKTYREMYGEEMPEM